MKKILLIATLFALTFCSQKKEQASEESSAMQKSYATTGSIERIDERLNDVINPDAKIEVLSEGFNWSEGPLWLEDLNAVVFSDVPENKVYKWSKEDSTTLYLDPSGYTGYAGENLGEGSNGLLLNPEGQLVLCQHGDRRIASMDASLSAPASEFVTIVDNYQGKKFNSPNDACYDSNGNLYFTDPPYGLKDQDEDSLKELDVNGVYLHKPNGSTTLVVDTLTRPNGIALSPDELHLVVANSDVEKAYWAIYDVQADGTLANGRLLHDATEQTKGAKGLPDGMKIDSNGNVFASGPGGIWILDLEGNHLGTLKTGKETANCALSPDEKTIYITADDQLQRVVMR